MADLLKLGKTGLTAHLPKNPSASARFHGEDIKKLYFEFDLLLFMIYYTIYTSTPREPMTRETLDEIAQASKKNNPEIGVSGILLGIENKYLQYLEGDEKEVEDLFAKIKGDPRHYDVRQWLKGFSDERIFKGWSMASWLLTNEELEKLDALKELKEFVEAPENSELQSKRFLGMMHGLLTTWMIHEDERLKKEQ